MNEFENIKKQIIADEALNLIAPTDEDEAKEELSMIKKIEQELKKELKENFYYKL